MDKKNVLTYTGWPSYLSVPDLIVIMTLHDTTWGTHLQNRDPDVELRFKKFRGKLKVEVIND